jgi:sulfoxide reductase catalytic subunit YedY
VLVRQQPRHPIASSDITDPGVFAERRQLLKAALATGMGLGAGSIQAAYPKAVPTPYGKSLELTAEKHVVGYNNFYEFGTGKTDPAKNAHTLQTRPWTIKVDGACETPGEMGIEDILNSIQQEERIYRFRCVEAWGMVVPWNGFSLATLLKRFKPTSKAKYVYFETLHDEKQMPGQKRSVLDWPYREGLRMDEAMHPLTMLVTGVYGKELPNQNGAPLRLIVPWKYGFKSIKSIVKISFAEKMPDTSWWMSAPNEYGFYANVNPQVDHPRWSQKTHRMLGDGFFDRARETLMFNGYAEEVASLYKGMDLRKFY